MKAVQIIWKKDLLWLTQPLARCDGTRSLLKFNRKHVELRFVLQTQYMC